jgi:hypothetical protein
VDATRDPIHSSGCNSFSEKLVKETIHRLSTPSQRRQCGEDRLRIFDPRIGLIASDDERWRRHPPALHRQFPHAVRRVAHDRAK